ncbi:MAG: ATP-binding protein [Mogibacterium sp.]|nr:ATP-binding protein [Mogibacterium sp.]
MTRENDCIHLEYDIADQDFARAGEASSDLKKKLKQLNVNPKAIRRVSIAMYEGEINMVIHANGGKIYADIYPDHIDLSLQDVGPGIPDIEKAMQIGYSTAPAQIMALGFGAGMGLPNMKKNSDKMEISSVVGQGTTVNMTINFE